MIGTISGKIAACLKLARDVQDSDANNLPGIAQQIPQVIQTMMQAAEARARALKFSPLEGTGARITDLSAAVKADILGVAREKRDLLQGVSMSTDAFDTMERRCKELTDLVRSSKMAMINFEISYQKTKVDFYVEKVMQAAVGQNKPALDEAFKNLQAAALDLPQVDLLGPINDLRFQATQALNEKPWDRSALDKDYIEMKILAKKISLLVAGAGQTYNFVDVTPLVTASAALARAIEAMLSLH